MLACCLLAAALLTAGCGNGSQGSSLPRFCVVAVGNFRTVLHGAENFTGPVSDNVPLANLRLLLEPKLTSDAPAAVKPAVATVRKAAAAIASGDHNVLKDPHVQSALISLRSWAQANCFDTSR